jgi:hypothetical protein
MSSAEQEQQATRHIFQCHGSSMLRKHYARCQARARIPRFERNTQKPRATVKMPTATTASFRPATAPLRSQDPQLKPVLLSDDAPTSSPNSGMLSIVGGSSASLGGSTDRETVLAGGEAAAFTPGTAMMAPFVLRRTIMTPMSSLTLRDHANLASASATIRSSAGCASVADENFFCAKATCNSHQSCDICTDLTLQRDEPLHYSHQLCRVRACAHSHMPKCDAVKPRARTASVDVTTSQSPSVATMTKSSSPRIWMVLIAGRAVMPTTSKSPNERVTSRRPPRRAFSSEQHG